jgi:hypothetical protein
VNETRSICGYEQDRRFLNPKRTWQPKRNDMKILSRLFQSRPIKDESDLVGCWHLMRADDASAEPAEADFREDGRLYYSVLSGDRWQIMKLRYRVDGGLLVTDQPSHPREERTRFSMDADGSLILEFEGQRSWFKKGPKRAPAV